MDGFIEQILSMSLTAGVVILVVIAIRFLMRKIPRKYIYMLWAAVGFRLLCPVSVESRFSIFNLKPAAEVTRRVQRSAVYTDYIRSGNASHDMLHEAASGQIQHAARAAQTAGGHSVAEAAPAAAKAFAVDHHTVMFIIWLIIAAAILGLALYHIICLKIRLRNSRKTGKMIYESELITSPFAMGIIKPGIYLPVGLSEGEKEYLVEHERTHIRRGDLIYKMIAVAALAVHWFNPLVWIAFVLFCRDMEMSCDEIVVEKLGDGIKRNYTMSLVTMAAQSKERAYVVMPTSFSKSSVGKNEVKIRIKNIMGFRKRSRKVAVAAVMTVSAVLATCVLNAGTTAEAVVASVIDPVNKITSKETAAASGTSSYSSYVPYGDFVSTNGALEDQTDYMVLCSGYQNDRTINVEYLDDLNEIEDADIRAIAEEYTEQGFTIYDQDIELERCSSWGDGEYMFKNGFYALNSEYTEIDGEAVYEAEEAWVYKMNETLFNYYFIDNNPMFYTSFDKPRDVIEDDGTVIRYYDSACDISAEYNRDTGIGYFSCKYGDTSCSAAVRELADSYEDQGYDVCSFDPDQYYYYDVFYEEEYPYGCGISAYKTGDRDPIDGSVGQDDSVTIIEADEDLFEMMIDSGYWGDEISRDDDGKVITLEMEGLIEYGDSDYSCMYSCSIEYNRDTHIMLITNEDYQDL